MWNIPGLSHTWNHCPPTTKGIKVKFLTIKGRPMPISPANLLTICSPLCFFHLCLFTQGCPCVRVPSTPRRLWALQAPPQTGVLAEFQLTFPTLLNLITWLVGFGFPAGLPMWPQTSLESLTTARRFSEADKQIRAPVSCFSLCKSREYPSFRI